MSLSAHNARGRITNGANWFYWVAGVTALNSYFVHTDGSLNFFIGLGITQVFDLLAAGSAAAPLILSVDALMIGTCALVGYYARESRGLYVTGMVLYGIDTLLFVVFPDLVPLAFHLFALYGMFLGVRAFPVLAAMEMPGTEPSPSPSAV